jgi:hypothetical protein
MGCRGSPAGGWRLTAISAAQIATTRSRLSASAATVARPVGVKPTSKRPSADQTKWSFHTCCRGWNRETTAPLWGSLAVIWMPSSDCNESTLEQDSPALWCRPGRHDVIDGKGHVLPLLCGMTVLTARPRPMAYLYLQSTWERTDGVAPEWRPRPEGCGEHSAPRGSGSLNNHRALHTG